MRMTKAERVALANFGGHVGCSGPQPVYMKLVAAGYLVHEHRPEGLHEHSFFWAPGGEEEAARVRAELAPGILEKLEPEALEALRQCEMHPQLVKERLGGEVCRKTRPLMRTPLGKAVLELFARANASEEED